MCCAVFNMRMHRHYEIFYEFLNAVGLKYCYVDVSEWCVCVCVFVCMHGPCLALHTNREYSCKMFAALVSSG